MIISKNIDVFLFGMLLHDRLVVLGILQSSYFSLIKLNSDVNVKQHF